MKNKNKLGGKIWGTKFNIIAQMNRWLVTFCPLRRQSLATGCVPTRRFIHRFHQSQTGGSVASASALHPQHSHPHRELSPKRLDQFLPIQPPAPEHTVKSAQSSEAVPSNSSNGGQSPGGHPAMVHTVPVERPAHLFVSADSQTVPHLSSGGTYLMPWCLEGRPYVKSSGAQQFIQISQCGGMWAQILFRAFNRTGFRVSAGPLQHSTEKQLKVKCKGHACNQRTECEVQSMLHISNADQYLHSPLLILFIPNTSHLGVTFNVIPGRQQILGSTWIWFICRVWNPTCHQGQRAGGPHDCLDELVLMFAVCSDEPA